MSVSFGFIHAADLHVDSPFKGLSEVPPYVQEALLEATFDAVRNLVQAAIRDEVDFVVIAGDLYDLADRSLRAQLALQREWQQLHAHGVQLFVIHGTMTICQAAGRIYDGREMYLYSVLRAFSVFRHIVKMDSLLPISMECLTALGP